MRTAVVLLLALLPILAGCSEPAMGGRSDEAARQDLLAYVAGLRGAEAFPPGTAAYVVEVAWANGLDAAAWPADHPALGDVVVPAGGALLPALRPLYAQALADAPGAPERRARILAAFDGTQFGDSRLLNDDAFALLALAADGEPVDGAALQAGASFLLANRADGGWPYAVGGHAGVDTTGMVLAALAAAGRLGDLPAGDVVAFIQDARDGEGFAESPGGDGNCDSTAWALRAFALLGQDGPLGAWDFLRGLQTADGGLAYRPGEGSNPLCSLEAATVWGLKETGRLGRAPV